MEYNLHIWLFFSLSSILMLCTLCYLYIHLSDKLFGREGVQLTYLVERLLEGVNWTILESQRRLGANFEHKMKIMQNNQYCAKNTCWSHWCRWVESIGQLRRSNRDLGDVQGAPI